MGAPIDPVHPDIATNADRVRDRVRRAADRTQRDPSTVRLIAVSKKFPADHVRAAVAAGLTDFGENRVQEGLDKVQTLREEPLDITWHLIGHLQSNKARKAAATFPWIHSVDSRDLLTRLDHAAQELGTRPRVLIQVDLAGEATKHGASVDGTRRILEAASGCTAVRVCGLMLLPPWSEDPEATRSFFRRLRELRDQWSRDLADPDLLAELSMGMSHDLEVAIEEGATMIRVGTAIFGPRPKA